MTTSTQRHEILPWNGGFRCTRCGRRVADSGPTNGVECSPVTWESGTFELLHVSAGDDTCSRCGDPSWFRDVPSGWSYIVTDSNWQDQEGNHIYIRSGSYPSVPSLETAPECDGQGLSNLSPDA